MLRPTVQPYGERAVLLTLGDDSGPDRGDGGQSVAEAVAGWAEALGSVGLPGVVDVVPAASSVLLHCVDAVAVRQVASLVSDLEPQGPAVSGPGDVVEIPVRYDGPDLADVAEVTGLGVEGVVRAHLDSLWRVAFAGFAPGFAYLLGGDPLLAVPRRTTPRTRVPAGSVGLAAGYSAVYPRASPGGWQLIGHTDLAMWDVDADPPARLRPGQQVRFVAGEP